MKDVVISTLQSIVRVMITYQYYTYFWVELFFIKEGMHNLQVQSTLHMPSLLLNLAQSRDSSILERLPSVLQNGAPRDLEFSYFLEAWQSCYINVQLHIYCVLHDWRLLLLAETVRFILSFVRCSLDNAFLWLSIYAYNIDFFSWFNSEYKYSKRNMCICD